MLGVIGAESIDDLFVDVPAVARRTGVVDLPLHAGELEVEREMLALSRRNRSAWKRSIAASTSARSVTPHGRASLGRQSSSA